jgi:hypothetical protein
LPQQRRRRQARRRSRRYDNTITLSPPLVIAIFERNGILGILDQALGTLDLG